MGHTASVAGNIAPNDLRARHPLQLDSVRHPSRTGKATESAVGRGIGEWVVVPLPPPLVDRGGGERGGGGGGGGGFLPLPPPVVGGGGGGGGHPSRDRGHHWIGSCRSRRCLAGATLQQLPPAPSLPPKAVPLSREQLCSRVRLWFPVVSPSFAPTPSLDAHFPFQGGGVRQGSCCLGGLGSRPRARCTFAFGWAGTVSGTQGVGGG